MRTEVTWVNDQHHNGRSKLLKEFVDLTRDRTDDLFQSIHRDRWATIGGSSLHGDLAIVVEFKATPALQKACGFFKDYCERGTKNVEASYSLPEGSGSSDVMRSPS